MKLKSISLMIGLSIIAAGAASSTAFAQITANDDLNRLEGTNGNTMMRSSDNGQTWLALETTSTGETYGVNNNFPGSQTVIVANQINQVLTTPTWDENQTYGTAGTRVRYQGYYWTNQWWAGPGEKPGVESVWLKGEATNLQQNILGTFNFTPWTGETAEAYQQEQKQKVAGQRKVVGYFPEWGVYDAHNNFTPIKVNTSLISHLNYGFAVIKNGVVVMHDTEKAPELMKDLATRMAASGVKYMISIGGWDNSQEGVFEAATATAAGTERLAQSMVDYMLQWKFDGIDIDWEYPDTEAEKNQFTSLIQLLRSKLDAQGLKDDKYYQLSSAVTTNHNNIQYINPEVTAPLLDSVNVMAYDIHGAFDPITGHNAPQFANSKDADQKLNVSSTMQEYANTWHVPKSKLLMGVPFYGRGWGNVEPTEIIPGLPGLFAPGSATVKGKWDDVGQFTGTNPWYTLKEKLAQGYTRYWDSESHVPYMYNPTTKVLLTYDDPQSISEKVDYINQQGFAGAIIWDISGDTSNYELGKIVGDILQTSVVTGDDVKSFAVEHGDEKLSAYSINIEMSKEAYQSKKYYLHLEKIAPYANAPKNDVRSYDECYIDKGVMTKCPNVSVENDSAGNVKISYPRANLLVGSVVSLVENDSNKTVVKKLDMTQPSLNLATADDILQMRYVPAVKGATAATIEVDVPVTLKNSANILAYFINDEGVGTLTGGGSCGGIGYKQKNSDVAMEWFRTTKNQKSVSSLVAGDVVSVYLKDNTCMFSKDPKATKLLKSMVITPEMLK
ncbi:glycosyl hydrolase family 18 protein [Scandinavium hiltneri]